MNDISYFVDSTKNKKTYGKLEKNIETEVCIIGGGISALTLAYYLNSNKINTVILEKDEICSKTSACTTGKITSGHGIFYTYLKNSFGLEFAKKYFEANEEGIKNIKEIIQKEKMEVELEEENNYIYTDIKDEVKNIEEEYNVLKEIGADVELIDKFSENELPVNILKAIKLKNQAQFNPRKYCLSIADIISKGSVSIFENSKVIYMEKEKNRYNVLTEKGKVNAKYVVVATNYPVIDFPGMYFVKMYQSMSYGICVDLETTNPFSGMYITSKNPVYSFRSVDKGKLIYVVGEDHKTGLVASENAYENLENYVKSIYPKIRVKYRWCTEDSISLDKLPYVGEFSSMYKNVYVITGFKKWGMTLSNVAANIIKDKITKKENEYENLFISRRIGLVKNHKEFNNMFKQLLSSYLGDRLNIKEDRIENLQIGEAKVIKVNGKKVGVYKDEKKLYHVVDPCCAHLGCILKFNNIEKTWDCPCHGSRFDIDGRAIYAPTKKSLEAKEEE